MKHCLLTLLLAGSTTVLFAQYKLGLSTGVNTSFWQWEIKSLNHSIDYDPALGWHAAVLGEWQMNKLFGFRAALGLQVKANKMTKNLLFETDILAGNFDGSTWTFREFYQYLEGSLLTQVSPLKNFRQLYVLAGVSAGRLQSGWRRTVGYETEIKHSSKHSIDVKDGNRNRNAFAADFGIGGNVPLGANSNLKIELRFQPSLSSLAQSDDVNARVNPLLLNLGYLHRL